MHISEPTEQNIKQLDVMNTFYPCHENDHPQAISPRKQWVF